MLTHLCRSPLTLLGALSLCAAAALPAQTERWTESGRHPARWASVAGGESMRGANAWVVGSPSNNTIYTGDVLASSSGALSSHLVESFGHSVDLMKSTTTLLGSVTLIAVGAPSSGQGLPINGGRAVVFGVDRQGVLTYQVGIKSGAPVANGRFGSSVALAERNGQLVLLVGEPGNRTGRAHVFVWSDAQFRWVGEQSLSPFGAATAAGDGFGEAVAMHGDYALVGAPRNDAGGTDSGAAYLYRYDGTSYQPVHEFRAGGAGSRTGSAVAITEDLFAVGSPRWDRGNGRADVFRLGSTIRPVYTAFGDELGELGCSVALWSRRSFAGDLQLANLLLGERYARRSGAAELHQLQQLPGPGNRLAWGKLSDWRKTSFGTLANFGYAVALGDAQARGFVLTGSSGNGHLTCYRIPVTSEPPQVVGAGRAGHRGLVPQIGSVGQPESEHRFVIEVDDALPFTAGVVVLGDTTRPLNLLGGTLHVNLLADVPILTDGFGQARIEFELPSGARMSQVLMQALLVDPGAAPEGVAFTPAVETRTF